MTGQQMDALALANRARQAKKRLRAELMGLDRRQALAVAASILEDDRECTEGLLAGVTVGTMLAWVEGTGPAQAARLCSSAGTDATRKLREITPLRRAALAGFLRRNPQARRLPDGWEQESAA